MDDIKKHCISDNFDEVVFYIFEKSGIDIDALLFKAYKKILDQNLI